VIDVQFHLDGAPARAALRAQIRALQETDPLRPVTVAVPSNYAGLALRRTLARPDHDARGGLLNVRFLVLARVIELLGAPLLAGRGQRPLTSALRAELIRIALQKSPGVFEPFSDHPATEHRLEETFRELAELTEKGRVTLSQSGEQVADVLRLFEVFQSEMVGRYYDDAALALAATEAARSQHPALRDVGALVVFSPRPLARTEHGFVEALAEVEDVTVLLTTSGDPVADGPTVEEWEAHAVSTPPASEPPAPTHVVSAPDADEEVRHALRMVIEQIEAGTPLHRIALLSRHASPYAALVSNHLEAAGIPWNGANQRTLAQMATGRALLGLLNLPVSRFARSTVSAWLSVAPILHHEHGQVVPGHRWDAISRGAGIVRGREEWATRLDRYMEQLRRERDSLDQSDDPADWRLSRLERSIEETGALRAFTDELFQLLNRDAEGDWTSFSAWAGQLLERYVGTEASLAARLPEDIDVEGEIDAYRATSAALESLAGLADIRPTVDLATFRRVLQRELDRPAKRVRQFGEGVFVGRLSDAAGTDFDHVFLLGMNDGVTPAKGSDDPLIPESMRDGIDGRDSRSIRSRHLRSRSEERRIYLAALAAAPAHTLLAARADLRGQQGQLRSRWLLESASRLAGRRLTNEDMEHLDEPWHTLIPSFDGGLGSQTIAASLSERDLRSLRAAREGGRPIDAHPLAQDTPVLRHGWDAQNARRSRQFTRWDGRVEAPPESIILDVASREQSPTSLQRWATCPRQYFFATVLRVAERDDPNELLSISPADRGTLIHVVLERFITERQPKSPETAWRDDDRDRLMAIAAEECLRAEEAKITGAPLLWRIDRARILRDIEAFPAVDEAFRADAGVVPVATELAFGGDVPITVDLGDGRIVRLRGRIDRVDRSADGERLVVTDYKSGSPSGYRKLGEDPVQAGRLLQLPVYALGARAHYPRDKGVINSRYWFTRQDIEDRDRFAGYLVDDQVEADLRDALRTIVDGVTNGNFIGVPGTSRQDGGYEHCQICPYNAVCSSDRAAEFTRKVADPALAPFVALGGIGAGVEEDDA
jgi:ATP-dependent helicase/nuclease subunit B